jgi:hypothetical protein
VERISGIGFDDLDANWLAECRGRHLASDRLSDRHFRRRRLEPASQPGSAEVLRWMREQQRRDDEHRCNRNDRTACANGH